MPDFVKIPLKTPIVDHSGLVKEIVLKAPTFDDYMDLGDPYDVAVSPDSGARFAVQNSDVIKSYIERCLSAPSTPDMLSGCGVQVARKVRTAILNFFQDGDGAADEASPNSPTSSSSEATPTSTPAPSAG